MIKTLLSITALSVALTGCSHYAFQSPIVRKAQPTKTAKAKTAGTRLKRAPGLDQVDAMGQTPREAQQVAESYALLTPNTPNTTSDVTAFAPELPVEDDIPLPRESLVPPTPAREPAKPRIRRDIDRDADRIDRERTKPSPPKVARPTSLPPPRPTPTEEIAAPTPRVPEPAPVPSAPPVVEKPAVEPSPEIAMLEPVRPRPVDRPAPPAAPDKPASAPEKPVAKPSPEKKEEKKAELPPAQIHREGNQAVTALLQSADQHIKNKQLDKAGAALERALRVEPRNPTIWHDLAQIRLHQGQYQQAESLASKSNNLAGGGSALQAQNAKVISAARQAAGQ